MGKQLGLMTTASVEHQYLDGQAYMDCAQSTAAVVDQEVKELLEQTYAQALKILQEHRPLLDEIAEFLLMKETITGEELMSFVNAESQPKLPQAQEPDQAE